MCGGIDSSFNIKEDFQRNGEYGNSKKFPPRMQYKSLPLLPIDFTMRIFLYISDSVTSIYNRYYSLNREKHYEFNIFLLVKYLCKLKLVMKKFILFLVQVYSDYTLPFYFPRKSSFSWIPPRMTDKKSGISSFVAPVKGG